MAEFCVYRYDYMLEGNIKFLPADDDIKDCEWHEAQRRLLSKLLHKSTSLSLRKVVNKDEAYILNARILQHDDDVFLLRVPNRKVVKIFTEDQDDPVPTDNRPQCYVIIDNRPGAKLIFVEKNEAFRKNAVHAVTMLSVSIENLMQECNCILEIRPRVFANGMVQRVKYEAQRGNPITGLSFKITDPQQMQKSDDDKEASDMILAMLKWNETFGLAKASFESLAETKVEKRMVEINNLAFHVLDLLHRNNYETRIDFQNAQPYLSSEEALAFFSIDDKEITDFRNGIKDKDDFDLPKTLSGLKSLDENYKYSDPIRNHEQRRNSRDI